MYESHAVVQVVGQLCREDSGGSNDEHTLAVGQGSSVWGCIIRNIHNGKGEMYAL